MRILIFVLLLLLGWLQYRLWVGEGSLAEVAALRHEILAQGEELEKLRTRNRRLQAEVEDLRQGQDALEERARSELGMIKEGEIFLQVIEPQSPAPLAGGEDKVAPLLLPKPVSKPESKPAAKPEAKPAPKSEAKPATKPEPKPASKPEARSESKPAAKAEARSEPKPAPKPEPKPATKPAPKAESKTGD